MMILYSNCNKNSDGNNNDSNCSERFYRFRFIEYD